MKTSNFFIIAGILSIFFASCSENDNENDNQPVIQTPFHVAADVTDPDDNVAVFMQPLMDISEEEITFENKGYEMEGVRSARVLTAGEHIYNLNYGGGTIAELMYDGIDSYTQTSYVSIEEYVGLYPRFGAIGDDYILAHNVVKEMNDTEDTLKVTLQIVKLSIPGLALEAYENIVLGEYAIGEYYVGRVDAPVVLENKLFYGAQYRIVGESGRNQPRPDELATVVLDWPTLTNPSIVTSAASKGDTYGYRAKSMHVYNNKVYQINMTTTGSDAVITRLNSSGTYDNDYVLNITNAMGGERSSVNWHNGGNGKFYAAIKDNTITNDNAYEMVYINLDAGSIEVIPNVPKSDMWYYQSGAIEGDSFHIAVSPIDEDAYIWALNETNATKGAKLNGGNIFVQGIYK
jgi:hypothetical protein